MADGHVPLWRGDHGVAALQDPALFVRVRQRLETAERTASEILFVNELLLREMSIALMDLREMAGAELQDWFMRVLAPDPETQGSDWP